MVQNGENWYGVAQTPWTQGLRNKNEFAPVGAFGLQPRPAEKKQRASASLGSRGLCAVALRAATTI
eukprot:14040281-Alexandrium_andersonii.AAC.1